ncbi:unnamed protein product [Durusdinium trenchii]|uniref:Uncharacterized protein n=2 Tax=Durusdinium trenchii TaxID=1381693 RepID=A0ABP0P983_9DINO
MVLSFSPGWWSPAEMSLLNDFRMAMDELLASPEQETADIASNAYNKLMFAVAQQKQRKDANNFLPDADYDIKRDNQVQARLVAPPCGNLELYEVGGHVHARQHTRPEAFAVEHEGAQEKFSASPAWLRSLSELARQDLEGDLQILRQKFGLSVAELSETRKHGLPTGLAVDIAGPAPAVEAARIELVEGILKYYGTQVEWSAAELPAEPDEEPPTRSAPSKRPLESAESASAMEDEAKEPAPEPWGDAPAATEVVWDDAPQAVEVSWDQGEPLPGLREALRSVNSEHLAKRVEGWVEESGAVSVQEVIENIEMLLDELGLDAEDAKRLQQLR